jgi:hypothetical protein
MPDKRRNVIDEKKLVQLASFGLTQRECAVLLECSVDTIQRNYRAQYEEGLARACGSLRRKQFELAIAGNATMLIWLGKNLLGQADKQEVTGKDGAPLMQTVDREEIIAKLIGAGATEEKPTVQ